MMFYFDMSSEKHTLLVRSNADMRKYFHFKRITSSIYRRLSTQYGEEYTMKRYFNMMKEKQVVMIEFDPNSIIRTQDIASIFGSPDEIVELTKSQYRQQMFAYEKTNETNMSMTITR